MDILIVPLNHPGRFRRYGFFLTVNSEAWLKFLGLQQLKFDYHLGSNWTSLREFIDPIFC